MLGARARARAVLPSRARAPPPPPPPQLLVDQWLGARADPEASSPVGQTARAPLEAVLWEVERRRRRRQRRQEEVPAREREEVVRRRRLHPLAQGDVVAKWFFPPLYNYCMSNHRFVFLCKSLHSQLHTAPPSHTVKQSSSSTTGEIFAGWSSIGRTRRARSRQRIAAEFGTCPQ